MNKQSLLSLLVAALALFSIATQTSTAFAKHGADDPVDPPEVQVQVPNP